MPRTLRAVSSFLALTILSCQQDLAGPESFNSVEPLLPPHVAFDLTGPACGEEQFIEIFTDDEPGTLARIESVLTQDLNLKREVHFIVQPTSQLVGGVKSTTQVVIIPSNVVTAREGSPSTAANVNAAQAQVNLLRFVEDGGILVMHMRDNLLGDSYQPPLLSRVTTDAFLPPPVVIASSSHPVVLGPDLLAGTMDDWTETNIQCQDPRRLGFCTFAAVSFLPPLAPDAHVILTASGEPVLAEYSIGLGAVILTSIFVESGTAGDPGVTGGEGIPRIVLRNTLSYATLMGSAGDTDPPVVSAVVAEPNPAPAGATVRVEALAQDTGCGSPAIQGVQYSLDNGPFTPMVPMDGAFGGSSEGATEDLSFQTSGVHEICVNATDTAGNLSSMVCTLLAIYDPGAGFVTGAGLIDSPLGAYPANPNLKGLARFAFVSRYQRGATVPEGNTQFVFQAAQFEFQSSAYEWLVVSGSRAQFKGIGTVNGGGDYGFLLTAIDGDFNEKGSADKFRIKIWDRADEDAIVYDNQMNASDTGGDATELEGGAIRIHTN